MKSLFFTCASVAALTFATHAAAAPISFDQAGFAKMDQSVNNRQNLGKDVGFNGATTEDFFWQAGETIDWTYAYDGVNVSFTWGGVTVTRAVAPAGTVVGFEGYVRNTSKNNLPDDLTLTVDIGPVGGTDLGPITANLGDNFVNFSITETLGETWNIGGTAIANWTGSINTSPNSRLAFQIDAIVDPSLTQVSEPAALGVMGMGLLTLGMVARRRRS
ncbi:MAG: choice-of-anchor W domain-containing protein [Pseudomonadota bacterium]